MAPKIKLIYFNAEGRAELTRMILAQAGVEFEDVRVKRDDWPAMKPSMKGITNKKQKYNLGNTAVSIH